MVRIASGIEQPRQRKEAGAVRFAALILGMITLANGTARADRRHFVWTYDAQTLERGESEIETYTTFSAADRSHTRNATSTTLQFELETGMTPQMDFSVYQVFAQDAGEPMRYEGYKLRMRHRLTAPDRRPFAAVAYAEYEGRPDFSTSAVETKLILGRGIGDFRLAVNGILELVPEAGEWEVEPAYAAGAAWQASELLSLGLEAKGGEEATSIGPVIGHGLGDLWVAFGSALRLDEGERGKKGLETRLILGVKVR